MALGACGGPGPSVSTSTLPPAPTPEIEPPAPIVTPSPDLGLIPLPSVRDVREAAPAGRPDPFQPLPAVSGATTSADAGAAIDSTAGLTLTGVMLVGQQRRALVQSASGSAVLCIGADGRCAVDDQRVLPETWSVLAIDVQRGCLQLVQDGEPREAWSPSPFSSAAGSRHPQPQSWGSASASTRPNHSRQLRLVWGPGTVAEVSRSTQPGPKRCRSSCAVWAAVCRC